MVNFFTATTCYFDHLTPLFFERWSRVEETGVYWFWPNVWGPNCGNTWDAPQFQGFVEDAGLVEYWREKDWPDVCRPDGDGFVCGQAVYEVKAIE